jgi:serine/threonine protein kinase
MTMQQDQVTASAEALVGQIAEEFTQRLNRGEQPAVEEYLEQYAEGKPSLAGQIRQALLTVLLLRRPDVEAVMTDADPYIGMVLGDFRIIRVIGRGGMGIVYEAEQLSMNRTVALKVLPLASALDSRQIQLFKNEAKMAGQLHHEHIVPVYCVGCERGVHFYAMELVDGHSLAVLIREMRRLAGLEAGEPHRTAPYLPSPAVPPDAGQDTAPLATFTTAGSTRSPDYFRTVARLGQEAARGLEYAHLMGVRHRDIKPGNLLVDSRGSLWITDFGLAQMRSETEMSVTGELPGTPRYMSPEQTLGNRVPVDERTDIYSLGVTLYELLTLEPAFNGSDRQELIRQINFDDPRPPRRLNRRVPRNLETIVVTAMAKSPARRYASARDLAEDLRLFLDGLPIKARREGPVRWLWGVARRHATAILLGLSALVTATVLLLFFLYLNKPTAVELEKIRQEQALMALTQDLDLEKKVTLIGERGRPGYFRWRSSEAQAKIAEAPDGSFSVQSWEHGLLELLPDPRLERYRFSAEVRHEKQTNHESIVGIYLLHSAHQQGETLAHFHCNVAFNDLVDVGAPDPNGVHRGNAVWLQVHRQLSAGLVHHVCYVPDAVVSCTPAKPVGALGPWRSIAVEVRPETIKVFWEGHCIGKTSRDNLMFFGKYLMSVPDEPPLASNPQFSSRDGLGLFVSQGVASFRNVTVEPIGEEN